jgi:hypothetical protein
MLHMFHTYVAKCFIWTLHMLAMVFKCFLVFCKCFRCMLQVFQLFQTYIASVSSISDVCCKCFICFGHILQVFYLDDVKVDWVLHISNTCEKQRGTSVRCTRFDGAMQASTVMEHRHTGNEMQSFKD